MYANEQLGPCFLSFSPLFSVVQLWIILKQLFASGSVNIIRQYSPRLRRIIVNYYGIKRVSMFCLITYFVEHFYVSRSERIASSEKPTVTSWISWRNGVCLAASGIRSWVAQRVVRYADVMIPTSTKSGSAVGAVIHCVLLISILSQFDRIVSIFVVKREQKSFTGCGVTARTWKDIV